MPLINGDEITGKIGKVLGSLKLPTGTTSLVPTPLVMVKYLLGIQPVFDVKFAAFRRKVGLLLTEGTAAVATATALVATGMREVRGCTRRGVR